MLFTSLQFIAFLALLTLLYYCIPKKLQWMLLLLASFVFYYSIAGKLLVFVLFAGGACWACALALEQVKAREKQAVDAAKAAGLDRAGRNAVKKKFLPARRSILALFLLCVIGLLLVFKFYNMFAQLLAQYGPQLPLLRLVMPIGISFYSLMLFTYFMDIYNGRLTAERNPAKVMLYTCFFPLVIQGPIARWETTAPQLFAPHRFSYDRLARGAQRMLWGYFKKLLIADRLNPLTTALYSGYEQYQGFYVVVAAFAYTIQLYADFSGGIDIALGAAEILGIDLPENFQRPFFSKSISEFWRRWHITLGGFLRDYLFYPLTFSKPVAKLGKALRNRGWRWGAKWIPTYIAMLIVWFISGAWHGEGWQYIVNGLWHGFLITGGETIEEPARRLWKRMGVSENSLTLRVFRVMRTFCLVAVGEIMFRSENLAMMTGMFRGLFSTFNPWILFDGSLLQLGIDAKEWIVLGVAVLVLLGASLLGRSGSVRDRINRLELPLRWAVLLAGLFAIVVFGVYGPEYDPSPFIYFQF